MRSRLRAPRGGTTVLTVSAGVLAATALSVAPAWAYGQPTPTIPPVTSSPTPSATPTPSLTPTPTGTPAATPSATPTVIPTSVPAPPGTFPTVVATETVTADGVQVTATVSDPSGSATVTVTVPPDALPPGTRVSVAAPDIAQLATILPPDAVGQVASAFAVTWVAADGSKPTAKAPITITVHDSGISAGDLVYEVTASGLVLWPAASTSNGAVTVTFTGDPGFVVLPKAVSVAGGGPGGVSATPSTSGGGTGRVPFTGLYVWPMTGAGLALMLTGAVTVAGVRRRRPRRPTAV